MIQESYSVLLVCDDNKIIPLIKAFLVAPLFNLTVTEDFYEASRLSEMRKYDFIIADSKGSSAVDFAVNISDSDATVLILVNAENFEEISYRVERFGILTVSKPLEATNFYNMIKVAIAVHYKIQTLSTQTIKLKTKMEEIRIVNRAKLLLVEKRGMSESEAHRYLEKEAMDNGLKRIAVAEMVIHEWE